MNKFDKYLRETKMTSDDAAKILGITDKVDADGVKIAYRKASMKAHPDRGGNKEDMQAVNAAYELLKNGFGGVAASRFEDYKARKAMYEQAGESLKEWFTRNVVPANFQKYFGEMFGQEFAFEEQVAKGGLDNYVSIKWIFTSKDGEVWFQFNVFASTVSYFHERQKFLTGNPEAAPVAYSVDGTYMTNNRKQNIAKKDYTSKTTTAPLTSPELTFPRDKLLKGAANKTSKFSRRHFDTALFAKIKASQYKNHYTVELENGMQFTFWRMTMMGTAAYSFLEARDMKVKGAKVRLNGSFPETENALTALIELSKRLNGAALENIPDVIKAALPTLQK